MDGWVGPKKNEINAILNSVEVKVEVGVELGKMVRLAGLSTSKRCDVACSERMPPTLLGWYSIIVMIILTSLLKSIF